MTKAEGEKLLRENAESLRENAELRAMVTRLTEQIAKLTDRVAELVAVAQRKQRKPAAERPASPPPLASAEAKTAFENCCRAGYLMAVRAGSLRALTKADQPVVRRRKRGGAERGPSLVQKGSWSSRTARVDA